MDCSKIYALKNMRGANKKKEFIRNNAEDVDFKLFLYYALNPMLSYNLSEKTLSDLYGCEDTPKPFLDIFDCCQYLSCLRAMDDDTLAQVKALLRTCGDDERELYIQLLSKTLRLGVTAKTVNKEILGLIPVWEVQQAFPIDTYPIPEGEEFWLTQKLNGTRATFHQGRLRARSGTEYKGLDHIVKEIMFIAMAGFVLDGELTLKDKGNLSDNEAFRKATGIINSDSEDKSEICYTVFDIIPLQIFEENGNDINYSVRRLILDELAKSLDKDGAKYVSVLPVLYHGKDQKQISSLLDKMIAEDKEGLIANLDVPYKRQRHRGILKIKRFYTMDLPIVRCEEGTGRLAGTLGAFVVDFDGNEVNVGSGFSDDQRREFWKNKENLIGALCEVKYKDISSDKSKGGKSLQFPIFVGLRTDKTEVSYG